MTFVMSAVTGASGAVVAVVLLVAALLFVPWSEPVRRAETLVRAWRGDGASGRPRSRRSRSGGRRQ